MEEDVVHVRVRATPEKGAANSAVIGLLAEALGVSKSSVRMASGFSGRRKLISVDGMDASAVKERLRQLGNKK